MPSRSFREPHKPDQAQFLRALLRFGEDLRTKMLLQVHDELVFETPKEEMDTLKDLVFDEMPAALDQYVNLDVSLKVDVKWGSTWGDMG